MSPITGNPGAIRFCAANVLNHGLLDRLRALQDAGYDVRIDACLRNCGPCRHAAWCELGGMPIGLDDLPDAAPQRRE